MDFDLFELEDDDILSSMCIITAEETATPSNPLPSFNCSGEDSLNSQLSSDSFVRNFYIFNQTTDLESLIELTRYKFKGASLNSSHILDHVFGRARMHIQSLWADINGLRGVESQPYWKQRRQVTLLLQLIRANMNRTPRRDVQNGLKLLRTLLNRLGNMNTLKTVYLANSIKGNETDISAYHFLHGFLEWQFLDLLIIYERDSNIEEIPEGTLCKNGLFEEQYFKVLNNLLLLTVSLFKRKKLPDLLFMSPFPCTCIKENWLMMQFLSEKSDDYLFWKFFNKIVENMKNNPENYSLTIQSIPEVIIFLLKGVVRLQGYKINGMFEGPTHHRVMANYDLLESIVDAFLGSNPSEEQMRVFICILMPIILEWWSPKVDISMNLWEYFHKKLNSSFFIAGTAPSNLAVASSSGKNYLIKMKTLLDNAIPDINHSSFSLFTVILGKTITRFIKAGQTNQTQKILGRIYSKFSASKFLALNETGIHHLIELFLSLAISTDSNEIALKLKDKLLSIPLDKLSQNRQACLAKGHLALLILFSERSMDISEYVKKLLEQIALIKNDTMVSKLIADSLCDIFSYSESFDRGEFLLIDTWLSNYLNTCTSVEQERLLETLHNVFNKIKSNILKSTETSGNTENLLKTFSQHILPFVKQNFITSFSTHLPHLAADFCILSAIGPNAANDQNQFQKLFKFFIEANCNNKQSVPKFLLEILSSNKANLIEQSCIIQIWLKSLVLLSPNNEDVLSLTKIIITLEDFKIVSSLSPEELLKAKEPLCAFISSVGKTYSNCEHSSRRIAIGNKFNAYLANFDKWLSDKNEKTEVSFRFYSFIAIVIFNCANIVYARSKVSCFFHVAMTRFIIPCSIQMGKAPEPKLAQMMHKVWPVLVQGIGTMNFKMDPYITKTLLDLIVKWTPHFKFSPNSKVVAKPFVNCLTLENEALSAFIFEKLATNFLTTQRRQLGPYACLVITIFQEVVDACSNDEQKLILFLKNTSLVFLEHLMMVDEIVSSRNMLLELLRRIFTSSAYGVAIKNMLIETLKTLTIKHLSYFTFFYFELLTQIVKLKPEIIIAMKEFLEEQIVVVEEKRGGGKDGRLRNCLDKLNLALISATPK